MHAAFPLIGRNPDSRDFGIYDVFLNHTNGIGLSQESEPVPPAIKGRRGWKILLAFIQRGEIGVDEYDLVPEIGGLLLFGFDNIGGEPG